jgi:hypothetical protein
MWLASKSVQHIYMCDTLPMSSATESPNKISSSGIFNLPTTELRFVVRSNYLVTVSAPSDVLYAHKRFRFREDEGLVGPRMMLSRKRPGVAVAVAEIDEPL